jgi:hypothetical protein
MDAYVHTYRKHASFYIHTYIHTYTHEESLRNLGTSFGIMYCEQSLLLREKVILCKSYFMRACMYVCIFLCICMYVCMYVCRKGHRVYLCFKAFIWMCCVCLLVFFLACMYVCMHACMHIYHGQKWPSFVSLVLSGMYVCMCMCTYICHIQCNSYIMRVCMLACICMRVCTHM